MLSPHDVEATWDAQLLRFTDHSLHQSFAWGRYKRSCGWTPRYFEAERDGRLVGMLQAFVRTYPLRTVVAWCPGGPVGCLDTCSSQSLNQLSRLLGARALYCRSSFQRGGTNEDVGYLHANDWRQPARTIGARSSMIWNLEPSEEQLLAGLNRDWRSRLRQAQQRNLCVERLDHPPVDELTNLCTTMNATKGLRAAMRSSQLAGLLDALGDQVLVYGCRDHAGQLIAFRSCAIQRDRAWELVAATSAEGRGLGAAFATMWAMVLECRRRGVTRFDLAGIDAVNAPGVASFKRRTGAQEVEWLGEWEWSSSPLLRRLVNVYVARRPAAALP